MIAKVTEQSEQIDLADHFKELIQAVCFVRKLLFQFCEIGIKVGRNRKTRSVGEMKMIYRVHLYPFGPDPQFLK